MWKCPKNHRPKNVIAYIPEEEIGINIEAKTGLCAGTYEDGIAGVPQRRAKTAEEETVVCPICLNYCEWKEE